MTVCSDLTPAVHIDQIVAKAHQRANNILRCFVSRDPQSLTKAFITFVRPLLEYNSIIWSPYLKQDIDRIETSAETLLQELTLPETLHI